MKEIHIACQYFLNYELDKAEVRRQVKMLADAGFKCIYAHARQGLITPYFSDKYWQILQTAIDECRENGVKFAIWDEDCYPSGVAGNRIIWEHPELAAQSLHFTVLDISRGQRCYHVLELPAQVIGCYTVCNGIVRDISSYCGTVRPEVAERKLTHNIYSETCKIPFPHWRASWNGRHFAVDYDAEESGKLVVVQKKYHFDSRHSSDLLNPETSRIFLELTHDEYVRRFGEKVFRENVVASFLDEPAPEGRFCWTKDFASEFKKQHGFDLLPELPHLILDIDEKSIFIRHCFRLTQQKLLTENYLGAIQKWCHAHGIQSVGHLSRSEYLSWSNSSVWPNEMKAFAFLDIPCADPLGAGEAWPDACAYHTGLKAVSSAAHIFNKSMAGGDSLAVLGHEATLGDLRFHLDYQIAMGLTYFNIHGLSYSLAGDRKDEVPPSIFYQHSQWEWMKYLLADTEKMCDLMHRGELCCQIAMLYPAATFYCCAGHSENLVREKALHELAEKLLSHQKDFIFIDEESLCSMISGAPADFAAKYPYFVIPEIRYLPAESAEALEIYRKHGGRLLYCGSSLPQIFSGTAGNMMQTWENPGVEICREVEKILPGPELCGDGARDILLTQRIVDGEKITYFFNRSGEKFTGLFEGETIYLAPGRGTVKRASQTLPEPLADTEKVMDLNCWNIDFPDNTQLLAHWEAADDSRHCDEIQLLERRIPENRDVFYRQIKSRFLFSGEVGKITMRMEKDCIDGGFECEVNGVKITGFTAAKDADCCFIEADISHAVRSGRTPHLNEIVFFPANGSILKEAPFLCGKFKSEFRHAGKTLPFLHGFDGKIVDAPLQLWSSFGYGSFSGSAVYSCTFETAGVGDFVLDLGEVYDLAEVIIDGKSIEVMYSKPYTTCSFALAAGTHSLQIHVANAPGNRDRLAGLLSGMTGPVTLCRRK